MVLRLLCHNEVMVIFNNKLLKKITNIHINNYIINVAQNSVSNKKGDFFLKCYQKYHNRQILLHNGFRINVIINDKFVDNSTDKYRIML